MMPPDTEKAEPNSLVDIQSRLVSQLRALGLEEGQSVLVRAAAKALGPSVPRPADALLDALLEAVGSNGTVLALTHSPMFPVWRRPPDYVFTPEDAPITTGGLAAALTGRPGAYRSRHPTNSIAGLGPQVRTLLQTHGPSESSFEPIRRLAEAGGQMLLVGCPPSSPGFSTVHVAQHMLGLTGQSLFCGMFGSPYRADDGRARWFTRRDHPGCSTGFARLYPAYRERGLLREGPVGDAPSIAILAAPALEIDLETLRADPCACACERADCTDCAARCYAVSRWLPYLQARMEKWHARRSGK